MPKTTTKTTRKRPARGTTARKPARARSAGAKASDAASRKLGLRGAAPWAARHAAKHAAEAQARNSSPAPPGSARATLRIPDGADGIKAKVSELHGLLTKIRVLRKNLSRGFYELGVHLVHIRDRSLFEAKGYGSFDQFVEREVDLGKAAAHKLMQVPTVFLEEAALAHGMDATLAALAALEAGGTTVTTGERRLPLKPPGNGTH